MPLIGTRGAASSRGFGRFGGGVGIPILTGTIYNSYNTMPAATTSPPQSPGTARVVLNGYGILFYGWNHSAQSTGMHAVVLPDGLVGQMIDITVIGSGGMHSGGGGGGGAGAGGGRHVAILNNLTVYLKTGTNSQFGAPENITAGSVEYGNTRFYANDGGINLVGYHAAENSSIMSGGCNVYNCSGPQAHTTAPTFSTGPEYGYITARDPSFQFAYGGVGKALNGFGSASSYHNGSDLGGGGGAQDHGNYGGDTSAGAGGRYGYSGGSRGGVGGGPVGGIITASGNYQKGGGGSFGGGVGDAGNNDTTVTGGGGAILVRWDTTLAIAQSGRPGWP